MFEETVAGLSGSKACTLSPTAHCHCIYWEQTEKAIVAAGKLSIKLQRFWVWDCGGFD